MKNFLVLAALFVLPGCLDHGREPARPPVDQRRLHRRKPAPPKPGVLLVTDGSGNILEAYEASMIEMEPNEEDQSTQQILFVGDSLKGEER